MQTGSAPRRLWGLAALSLVGLGISITQSQHYYSLRSGALGFKSFCNINSTINCDAVTLSRYAELVAGLPLSSFAAGWFLALFIFALMARSASWRRDGLRIAFGMTAFGTAFSAMYFYLMVGVIKSYCLLCLGVDAVNVLGLLIVVTLHAQWRKGGKTSVSALKVGAGVLIGGLLISVVGLKGMEPPQLEAGTADLLVNQVLTTTPVTIGLSDDLPSVGPQGAPITIVEFADFQCPSCKSGALIMGMIQSRFPGKVRMVFRNYPFDSECNKALDHKMHPAACEAARAIVCAHRQGKFHAAFESLFENQAKLAPGQVLDFVGPEVNLAELTTCVSSPEAANAVLKDIEEAERVSIRSTPTFFINGHRMEGALPIQVWEKIIEVLLKK